MGKDKKGIIAKVSTALYEMDINIEDISQTILQNYFTMIMAVETQDNSPNFEQITLNLLALGEKLGVEIHIQSQSIFDSMHKISNSNQEL
ncbi:MAG: ACT domain-containing protein [Clostridia bacterium]